MGKTVNFALSSEVEKDVLRLFTRVGERKKFEVPIRNRISDLQIPHSNILPVSHRDSVESYTCIRFLRDTRPSYC